MAGLSGGRDRDAAAAAAAADAGAEASHASAASASVDVDEAVEARMFFDPRRGNVVFASAYDGWACTVDDFARLHAEKWVWRMGGDDTTTEPPLATPAARPFTSLPAQAGRPARAAAARAVGRRVLERQEPVLCH